MMVLRKSPMNTLYYGDNLNILRRYIKDETVGEVFGELSRAALEPKLQRFVQRRERARSRFPRVAFEVQPFTTVSGSR